MALSAIIAWALIAVFVALSLVHVYWLVGGEVGRLAAIPEIDGTPVFQPLDLVDVRGRDGVSDVCLVDCRHSGDTHAAAVSCRACLANSCLGGGLADTCDWRLPIGRVL